ncbi:MerR family transcriptional regulator [Gordonia sp. HNM0687]|uniref:MerR family transcriptional regulator n=1 Tax=Gordonia mangrovi TaxID=2665643 RepID=A0A6L7GUE8_9ACTN|nr:MerR family transcriptional regulator [Gordonia mangrovi]MXP23609.1 MerR family transcriptional regulator [Gordonia mangrovi]UVF79675.1 MerR family transcriptional regulator [Gordonia mangrovi]
MTEYRIDDLARAAGTTTRNVRGYQDRGLLPRPLRRGRIAIYTDAHLARLKVINDLLKRGFTIRHIGEFLSGLQRGENLAKVLGLEELVSEPWSTATSTTVSADDLRNLLNSGNPAHYERLAEYGLVEPDGPGDPPDRYVVLDQETVSAYGRLVKLGLPLSGILDVHGHLDHQMSAVATIVISAGRRAVTEGHEDGWLPQTTAESDWATELLGELRRAGSVSAHNALDRALDRDLARQLSEYLNRARASAGDSSDTPAVTSEP